MSRREKKELSEADRIVWGQITRTVKPLRAVSEMMEPASRPESRVETEKGSEASFTPFLPPYVPPTSQARSRQPHLDRTDLNKLAKGRSPIEARLDLHGLFQSEAHALLLRFIQSAHAQGLRNVLVITGKGSARGSDGILRRLVPAWLATPPFTFLVTGHAEAHRRHGGSGAFYVRLRRGDRTVSQ